MIPPKEKFYLCQAILKFKDLTITHQEFELLDKMLQQYPESLELLTQVIEIHTQLNRSEGSKSKADNEILSDKLWRDLADEEKTAQIVKCQTPAADSPSDLVQEVMHEKRERKIRKSSLITFAASLAALIFLILFARYLPRPAGVEVATLTDSIKARWADTDTSMSKGTRFETNSDKYFLREGLAQLTFDNEAKMTLEGPVEFQILTEDQIKLSYGRLYATVPQGAIGFTVNTSSARIIDLGTEFGIEATASGDTYLHVIKGRTTLIAGEKSDKVSMEVDKGNAKKVLAATLAISDIPCNATFFVREINSKYDFVWKGQKQINLADIVGGGNGFGTGQFNFGINPVTGELGNIKTENRQSKNAYKVIQQNLFVDGVFVPNGNDKQIISSLGHIFEECPVTQGIYFTEITNNPDSLDEQSMTLNGVHYGTDGNACLFMHANLGVTFDLQAIRSQLPGKRIARFQSQVGISDTALRESNADFWVLVDGKLRYKKEHVQQKGLLDTLQIELSNTDRFLTLVTTDGGDPDARILPNGFIRRSIDCDWCIFGSPVLILE